jgi:predicted nucleotidyltransferase
MRIRTFAILCPSDWTDQGPVAIIADMAETEELLRYIEKVSDRNKMIRRTWLFGSRKAGTARRSADFDFAIEWEPGNDVLWPEFVEEVREENPTRFSIDLVRIDQVDNQLRNKILSDGRMVYERLEDPPR